MSDLAAFLDGALTDHIAIYLAEAHLENPGALADRAERLADGYVLVLPGERGRQVFPTVAGGAPMEFAQTATKREGHVDRDLSGGACPDDDGSGGHELRFVLAFAQEQTDDVGGPYGEGDVIHAYGQCACGTAYADRWVLNGD